MCPLWNSVGGALGVCLQGPLLRVKSEMWVSLLRLLRLWIKL